MVYELKKNLRRKVNSLISDEDITFEQYEVLKCLSGQDGMKQTDISKRINKDPATLTKMLYLLENRGYVLRGLFSKDRRVSNVYITAKGEEKVSEITKIIDELNESVTDGFSFSSIMAFKEFVYKLNKNLTENEQSAAVSAAV